MLFWAFLLIPLLIVASMSTSTALVVGLSIFLFFLVKGEWEYVEGMLPWLLLACVGLLLSGAGRNSDSKTSREV